MKKVQVAHQVIYFPVYIDLAGAWKMFYRKQMFKKQCVLVIKEKSISKKKVTTGITVM